MTPDPRNMSAEGLHDAAFGAAALMCEADDPAVRREQRKWLLRYLAELKRRALIAERPAFLRGAA
jgi:hypothetical protein